jgi:FkbM family methyltransferase
MSASEAGQVSVLKSMTAFFVSLRKWLRDEARVSQLESSLQTYEVEIAALKAQLRNVGLELLDAREALLVRERNRHDLGDESAGRYRRREVLILVPELVRLLPPGDRLVVVDCGSRDVDRDIRWLAFPPERLRFIGFEPDRAEAARLNETPGPAGLEWSFVPMGLWGRTGRQWFEHNQAPGGSSFLPQNRAVTDRWKFENPTQTSLAAEVFFPTTREEIEVISLSEWVAAAKIEEVDFLKLNVQGGEHEILGSSGPILDTVLGILVEVAFVESYHGRPLFSDIDPLLRDRGFAFFDLLAHHYVGRSAAPIAAQHLIVHQPELGQLFSSWGQLVEGHALYLRDPIADGNALGLSARQLLKLVALAETFGQVEYAFELLRWMQGRSEVREYPPAADLSALIAQSSDRYRAFLRNPEKPVHESLP